MALRDGIQTTLDTVANSDFRFNGPSTSNNINVTNNIFLNGNGTQNVTGSEHTDEEIPIANVTPTIDSQNNEDDEFLDILTTLEDQKDTENEKVLKLIWKYLKHEDKKRCTMACKRFNNFISTMDYFTLNIDMNDSIEKSIPILTRSYTTICIKYYEFYNLDPLMLQLLEHLRERVIKLKLFKIITSVKTLRELLGKLPNLMSIQLIKIEFEDFALSLKDIPKLSMLRNLEIEMETTLNMSGFLGTFDCASNIQSISLFKMRLEVNVLNKLLDQNRNSLEILLLENCSNDSRDTKCIYSSFNNLHSLRKLYFIHCKEIPLEMLKSKIMYLLTDFEVEYNSNQKNQVHFMLRKFYEQNQINENQLRKFETYNKPIITKKPGHFSEKIITKFYHFHNCTSGSKTGNHDICKSVPLMNLKSNLNKSRNIFSFLSIQVREDVKHFRNNNINSDYDIFVDCKS